MTETKLADQISKAMLDVCCFEEKIEAVLKRAGIGFGYIEIDPHDDVLDIYNCVQNLTAEQQQVVWDMGFEECHIQPGADTLGRMVSYYKPGCHL